MTITVTGHRPNKLWGHNMSDPRYQDLLGADMVFARAVLELRDETVHILCCGKRA